jgi:hypothetical protein
MRQPCKAFLSREAEVLHGGGGPADQSCSKVILFLVLSASLLNGFFSKEIRFLSGRRMFTENSNRTVLQISVCFCVPLNLVLNKSFLV